MGASVLGLEHMVPVVIETYIVIIATLRQVKLGLVSLHDPSLDLKGAIDVESAVSLRDPCRGLPTGDVLL